MLKLKVNMPDRTILHVDMNAFFASVEQRSNPHLSGKPILVCGNPKGRTVVATASYEARKFGIKTGMTIYEAKKLCPQVILVECDPDKYVDTATKLFNIYVDFTPQVEVFSIDEAFLDITGTERLFGLPIVIAQKIKQRIKDQLGLSCSIGIAPNKLLAKFASESKKPDGLTILTKDKVLKILENVPISELCGIGTKMTQRLNKLGIYTCGQLGRYPFGVLQRKFGIIGLYLHHMGLGEDEAPVRYYYEKEPVKSMGHSLTLQEDAHDKEIVKRHLLQLSEKVGRRLRRDNYQGRTISLILRYSDFETIAKQYTLKKFIDDGKSIYEIALNLLNALFIEHRGVRLVGVSVSNLICEAKQLDILPQERRRENLLYALDQINDKFGEFTITYAKLLEPIRGGNVISPAWRPQKHVPGFKVAAA